MTDPPSTISLRVRRSLPTTALGLTLSSIFFSWSFDRLFFLLRFICPTVQSLYIISAASTQYNLPTVLDPPGSEFVYYSFLAV